MDNEVTVRPEVVATWARAAVGSAELLADVPSLADRAAALTLEGRASSLIGAKALAAFVSEVRGTTGRLHWRVRGSGQALLETAAQFAHTDDSNASVVGSVMRQLRA